MTTYFGGYYLLTLNPSEYGNLKNAEIYSCSECVNTSLINTWSLSWTTIFESELRTIQEKFAISDDTLLDIRSWADNKFNLKKFAWPNIFADLDTLLEYQHRFFENLKDLKIISIHFAEYDADDLIKKLHPKEKNIAPPGIYEILLKKILESEDPHEITIGLDLIKIEPGGYIHSFQCDYEAAELAKKFGVTTNDYCLIDEKADFRPLLEYINIEENGHSPVPWHLCKVKMRV